MGRALELAACAHFETSPNPMVGAVVVRDGRVVAEGYHARAGGPHAEVVALERAGELARGAELYVTLEPCNSQGRTGPCTERIVAAGVRRVHAAIRDPNPRVDGKGMTRLREAGVEVVVGERREEAVRLIEYYSAWVSRGLPFVTLKLAASLDGKVATAGGQSRWITGEPARLAGHQLRRRHDAIMVGVGTVLSDDPLLTARGRGAGKRQPVRVVVDSTLRTPPTARVLVDRTSRTLIATSTSANPVAARALEVAGAEVLAVASGEGGVALEPLLRELARREITSVLVEGGPRLSGSLVSERLLDRVVAFIAPLVIGGQSALSAIGGPGSRELADAVKLRWSALERVGDDICLTAEMSAGVAAAIGQEV